MHSTCPSGHDPRATTYGKPGIRPLLDLGIGFAARVLRTPAFVLRGLCGSLLLWFALAAASVAADATYTYDALGRLTGVSYVCGSSIAYTYDAAGNRTSTVTAAPGSCPPTAVNDSMTTAFNTPTTSDPRANDSDPNGFAFTITAASMPGHGAAAVNSGTSVTYTPSTGYSGADSFTYTISNGHGSATATVSVTVNAP